jgi:hypothetical protein
MDKGFAKYFFLSFASILIFAVVATAQVTTADVVGRITDPSEAVIPGARVSIQNVETKITRSTVTGESGDYVINLLPPGRYTVSIEVPGFKTHTTTELILSVGDRRRVDVEMEVGEIDEIKIEVVSQAPMLQTDSSAVGALITENAVQDLPLNGRNYV